MTAATIIIVVLYWKIPKNENLYLLSVLFLFFIVVLPFLSNFSKDHSWDRRLGELSYPIYIVHRLVIEYVDALIVKSDFQEPIFRITTILVLTFFLSIVLLRIVVNPVEIIRNKLKRRDTYPGI